MRPIAYTTEQARANQRDAEETCDKCELAYECGSIDEDEIYLVGECPWHEVDDEED